MDKDDEKQPDRQTAHEQAVYSPNASIIPGSESIYDYSLIPSRVSGCVQRIEGSSISITVLEHRTVSLSRHEGIIWALCDGRSNIDMIIARTASLIGCSREDAVQVVTSACDRLALVEVIYFRTKELSPFPISVKPYSHAVTTRGGMYLVNRYTYLKVANGMFFGLTLSAEGNILAFEFPHDSSSLWQMGFRSAKRKSTNEGLVRRFSIHQESLCEQSVEFSGLANNTHYIVEHEGSLFSVDCEGQSIRINQRQSGVRKVPVFESTGYHHINSLAFHRGNAYVVKCLSGSSPGTLNQYQSSIGVFDSSWQHKTDLHPGVERAHDLLLEQEDDLVFWICDSRNGDIVRHPDQMRIKVRTATRHGIATRGLAHDPPDCLVVGSGFIGDYIGQKSIPRHFGALLWINKNNGTLESELPFPEAPCCIISLDLT